MVKDREGSLVCCSPWDHKEPDTTCRLNNKVVEETKRSRKGEGEGGSVWRRVRVGGVDLTSGLEGLPVKGT